MHCPGLPFLPPKNRHHYTSLPLPSSLFSTFLSVCRDNPLHQPRSTTNERVLPRKSSPLNPTPDATPSALLFAPLVLKLLDEQLRAQARAPYPLRGIRGARSLRLLDRPMQDEERDESVRRRCVHRSRLLRNRLAPPVFRKIVYHVDLTAVVNRYNVRCQLNG